MGPEHSALTRQQVDDEIRSKKFEKEFAKVKYDDGGHGVSDDV